MPAGISSRPTIRVSASSAISSATTKSMGSTSSTSAALRLLEHLLGGLDPLGLDDRVADLDTLGDEEGEAMPPPMSSVSQTLEELVDHAELVGHLAAAEDRHERALRVGEHVA